MICCISWCLVSVVRVFAITPNLSCCGSTKQCLVFSFMATLGLQVCFLMFLGQHSCVVTDKLTCGGGGWL